MTRALKAPPPPRVRDERPVDAADPTQLVQYAISRGVTPAELKDLMDLAQRERDRLAAERFGEAFAGFQADLPQIDKTRPVKQKNGDLMYHFAALEDIEREIQPIKAKYGLSTSGTIKNTPAGIEVVWVLQIGSHREKREYVLPPIPTTGLLQGGANATQNLGAWIKYIQRYTYTMSLGVVVRNEDTDANAVRDVLLLDAGQRKFIEDCVATGVVKPDGETVKVPLDGILKFVQNHLPEADRSLDVMTQQQFDKFLGAFKLKYLSEGGAA